MPNLGFSRLHDGGRRQAALWLALAVCAVAVAGLFAILIALARVPALGTLFPGPEFYRVALTLHVNLSQGVWFMAFAGMLWSLWSSREAGSVERLAWLAAVMGASGIAASVSVGRPTPVMSNYLPVLDSPVFLTSLSLFGFGIILKAVLAIAAGHRAEPREIPEGRRLALRVAAFETVAAFFLLIVVSQSIDGRLEGHEYFETLFWGAGHVWQFALLSLLMFCWLELAPKAASRLSPALRRAIVLGGALPVAAATFLPFLATPGSAAYVDAFTWLMRWTSWEAPLLLGLLLFFGRGAPAPGFGLSLLLFVAGLALGSAINGQTTLVTAHYHGTIGAVTLAFMAASFVLLPRLGPDAPGIGLQRLQLGLYGYGILLMMAGLAGAGLMGAPRKTPGDLTLTWSIETVSRMCLGMGGTLATAGIVMFAVLLLRRLFSVGGVAAYSL